MGQLNHSDSAVMIRMKTWVLVSRSLQLVLVLIVFLLTRFGLGTRVLQYGYEDSNTLYPTSALVIGGGWDHFWLHSSLPVYLLIISSISLSEQYQPSAGRCKNLILTTVGGIIYIISGTATLNYYIPLESTSQYPRDRGLALASLTIITGVIFLMHTFLELCSLCSHDLDQIHLDTRIPLHKPKNYFQRKVNDVDDEAQKYYKGQTVNQSFDPDY